MAGKSARLRLTALCLAASSLSPVTAAVIDYTNGADRATPVILTDNSTQLQVLAGSATQSGTISEVGGSFGFEKIGPGVLVLTAAETSTGNMLVSAGTLKLGSGGLFANGSSLTLNGGTFDLNGHAQTFSALSGAGTILGNQGFLTINGSDSTTLAASIVGADGLTKNGSGTLTLTGDSNFFASDSVIVNAGVLRVGNGATSGSIAGDVVDKATLQFNRSDTLTYTGRISGSGLVQQTGAGTLIVTRYSNQFSGSIQILSGALQIGDGVAAASYLDGNTLNNGLLIFNGSNVTDITYFGVISGTGAVQQRGGNTTFNAVESYTGGTTVSGGTLTIGTGAGLASSGALVVDGGTFNLNNQSVTVGALSGSGGSISLTGGTLTTNSSSTTTLASTITSQINAGRFVKDGGGTLILTGNSFVGGGITIRSGTLQIGNGGSTGLIDGNVVDNAALSFNRSGTITYANTVSGTGTVTQAGPGTLTLSGSNSYIGATAVNAGTLNVTGSIASSRVTVAGGAILTGTGTVGATTISSGGSLAPAGTSATGTLSVNGNLTLAPGSATVMEFAGSAADKVVVTGSASVDGALSASFASGQAPSSQYVLITATGGLAGSFASFNTTGLGNAYRASLSYDANNAYLNIAPNLLTPFLPTGISKNQGGVAAGIDAAVNKGAAPTGGFVALYSLSGQALQSALDQISGQAAPNVSGALGQSFLSFLSMTSAGGSDIGGAFAPGNAYGGADSPHRAQLSSGTMQVWGGGYGGHVGISGDAASGAAGLSSRSAGFIGGADFQINDTLRLGGTLGLGHQDFRSGNGTGDSDDVELGLYGRVGLGAAYIAAAAGLGWHDITTQRIVTVSGTDVLRGKQNARAYGGRLEAGWRIPLDDGAALAPYAAFVAQDFDSPAYAETAVSGASTFALSYAGQDTSLSRSELGAHLGGGAGPFLFDAHAAWAHHYDGQAVTQASFQNLAGANFQVAGVRGAADSGLLGGDAEYRASNGFYLAARGEAQLATGTTIVEGMGSLGWRW